MLNSITEKTPPDSVTRLMTSGWTKLPLICQRLVGEYCFVGRWLELINYFQQVPTSGAGTNDRSPLVFGVEAFLSSLGTAYDLLCIKCLLPFRYLYHLCTFLVSSFNSIMIFLKIFNFVVRNLKKKNLNVYYNYFFKLNYTL